ncbi:ABC transporter ATP-binding protein [Ensifer sp. ENS11]|jgi:ABC-type sugar transport system ATPase subunit|uniref:ABC transporter ATP-binding protein n=1 Tax=Ensifer sp. ENS11 TaxID=2769291 RepID=UPI00042E9F24|nr:ABC transporter ATP-binding protein [Ensifer sp. ENS11]AHK47417.1 sugar ABC transporter, ATP-binding protein, putative [Ensifer adhaerens OV14]MBD9490436.1 ABC transporter ATP-binding protein [Ensifer sp. ENS11]MDP9632958.1 ABC-type sugar transport system ATPase subunit [Ensifer adhaerens]
MADLQIDNLAKTFKGGFEAVRGISLDVADREAVFLLGPSGAGKTTTLRLVAGLEEAGAGRIMIGGRDVTQWTPRERNLAMVYDKHSLFPHLSVFENLAYPLRIRKMAEGDIRRHIAGVAETLQIEKLLERRPNQLSGGQMQRVAIGRALVRDADVFLLDEPISHLDAQLRARMRVEFKRLQREFKATMLYVSHDQLEAMTMADRIVLINKGRIEQIAAPQDLFDRPETLFAATFVGEPPMNVMKAVISHANGCHSLRVGDAYIEVDHDWMQDGEAVKPGGNYVLGLRPQQLCLNPPNAEHPCRVQGKVFAVETLGSRVVFDIEVEGQVVRAMTTLDAALKYPRTIGAPIAFRIDPDFVYLFDADTGRTVRQARFTRRRAARLHA